VLARFSAAYKISYPMLSDHGSVVIRKFGILNTNIPADVTRFYGIPFPGSYLIGPNGTVSEKLFLPDYQERPSASEILLTDFGVGKNAVVVKAEDVNAKITVSDDKSYGGHQLGVSVAFDVAPGWHIYGAPLPPEYTVTKVTFNGDLVESQALNFPPPIQRKFEALGQTFPVYEGKFTANGRLLLKHQLTPGDYKLAGTLQFQECNDIECKIPQSATFELPLKIQPMVPPAPTA
jgi:hypothetical protein